FRVDVPAKEYAPVRGPFQEAQGGDVANGTERGGAIAGREGEPLAADRRGVDGPADENGVVGPCSVGVDGHVRAEDDVARQTDSAGDAGGGRGAQVGADDVGVEVDRRGVQVDVAGRGHRTQLQRRIDVDDVGDPTLPVDGQ